MKDHHVLLGMVALVAVVALGIGMFAINADLYGQSIKVASGIVNQDGKANLGFENGANIMGKDHALTFNIFSNGKNYERARIDGSGLTIQNKLDIQESANNGIIEVTVAPNNISAKYLSGKGNAYACLDQSGKLFRSQAPCVIVECNDAVDNDGDGKVDFPADPGCTDPLDSSEVNSALLAECSDGVDNDGDSLVDYPADPGCDNINDDFEQEPIIPQCSGGLDNDHDGKIDYPADSGCINPEDNDESSSNQLTECNDAVDNDGDGKVDFLADPGCTNPFDSSEVDSALPTECSDAVDNDGDGKVDFPADPGCTSTSDPTE